MSVAPQQLTATQKLILIVDDTPTNIGVISGALKDLYKTKIATNGPKALALACAEEKPDLILLDVMMPDIGGHDVLRRLSETSDVPVVFLSARTGLADLREGYALGAVDYITKPFDPIALGDKVREVMARVARGEAEAYRRERLDELDERRS